MSRNRVGIRVPEEARQKIAFTKQGEKNYNTRLSKEDILNSLIEKIIISENGIDVRVFKEGLNSLAAEATVN